MSNCVPSPQNVEALAARRCSDIEPCERPQAAQERTKHEMGRIDEKYVALSLLGSIESWLQFGVVKTGLGFDVLGQVFLGGTGMGRTRRNFRPMSLRNLRTWV